MKLEKDCIFCKIAAGEIPSDKVYEDEQVIAFKDLNPQAPVHVLVVPKAHFATLAEMDAEGAELVKHALTVIPQIPSDKVYEDEQVIAFKDLNPQAPVHVLVVPKAHFATLAEMDAEGAELVKHALTVIPQIAASLGLANGYRLIVNQGQDAGQTVHHLHIHLLGGRPLGEKIV